jgi:phage-related protein
MKRTGVTTRYWLATLALASLLSAAPAGAQMQNAQPQDRDSDLTRRQLSALDQFLDNHPEVSDQIRQNPSLVNSEEYVESHPALKQYLQDHPEVREELNQNPNAVMNQEKRFDRREDRDGDRDHGDRDRDRDRDTTRGELSKMDRFMDSHPEIAEQVRKNPLLLDDRRFVEGHPALQEFLATHAGVREEVRENPNAFMSAEGRYDRREDMRLASTMDQFLDNHPEIAEQLRKNPALIDNKEFVENHSALQQFLAAHPELRQEFKSDPNAFMRREERFDRREDSMRGDPDVNRTELANMDRFMDGHPEIAEQLRKNPALVNNKVFVESHPALQQFLASHPGVREEYRENPSAFMHQEQRFDHREDAGFRRDGDVTRGELSSFHEFLQGHGNISTELSKNPALANNEEYVENHPALQTYLKTNPQVKEELKENPQSFVTSAQTFTSTTSATTTKNKTTMPAKGTAKPAAPQK